MNIFSKINSKKYLILAVLFLFLISFLNADALIVMSRVYFIDFSIEKASFRAGEEIKGNFVLWNYEEQVVPDITYSYKLIAEDAKIFDEKFSGDNFSIRPDQELFRSFNYRLPQNLPSGSYKFRVRLYNSKGLRMARKDVDITVRSDDRFLTLENHFILKDGRKLSPGGTAILDLGETAQASFDVSNKSSFQISASPRVYFYYYNVSEKPLQTINKGSISLAPGESKNKTFDLVKFEEPGIYFARVAMYQNNDIISNSIDFRFEISGKEMEIAQIRTDETSYRAGEEATITIDAGYKDSLSGKEGDLDVKIIDERGNVIGETRQTIDLKEGSSEVRVPITEDIHFPRVEITVIGEEEKILDRYEAQLKSDEPKEEQVEERDYFSVFALIILVGIIIFIIYLISKQKSLSNKLILFVVLFSAGVFCFGDFASANNDPIAVGPGLTISQSQPINTFLYSENSYVQFLGDISISTSITELQNNKMEFFIAKPGQVTTTTDNGVQVIDLNNSTADKLGEASPEDSYNIEYQEVFKIPFGYVGDAWFCTQFRGMDNGNNWYWLIYCIEVTVQTEEEGGLDLTLSAEEEEVEIGESVKLTVAMDNKSPCITFDSDIMQIIDISGSMCSHDRMINAKNASILFIDQMRVGEDKLGLATYETNSHRDSALTFDYDSIKSSIDDLSDCPPGTNLTCISCGMETANREMINHSRSGAAPYHILMTDGIANRCIDFCTDTGCSGMLCPAGLTASDDARAQAWESFDAGITIYTIGFTITSGSTAEQLMIDVAEITGGKYFHAPTGEELEQVYKTIAGLIIGYSLNTKILIEIPDNFQFTGWDSRCDLVNGDLECYVGDLPCGSEVNVTPFDFTVEALSGDPGDEVEIVATVFNDGGQKKETVETIRIRSALTVSNLSFGFPDPCGQSRIPNFYWDIDTNESYDYQIEICRQANCEDVLVDGIQGVNSSNITGWTPNCNRCCPDYSQVEFGGETYWGRLRVKDVNSEQWSSWIEASFSTFQNCWPSPRFNWDPEYPAVDQIVEFDDDSRCYNQNGDVIECSGWSWTFENGNPGFSTNRNPTVSFSTMEPSGNQATLLSCDNVSVQGGPYCCPRSENINVRYALPRWREIAPF